MNCHWIDSRQMKEDLDCNCKKIEIVLGSENIEGVVMEP